MPAERVTMRKIKDILRLKWACGLSNRQVAASCGVARSTVAATLYRAKAAGLSWPFPENLDDQQRCQGSSKFPQFGSSKIPHPG